MSNNSRQSESLVNETLSVFVIAAVALYAIGTLALAFGERLVGRSSLTPKTWPNSSIPPSSVPSRSRG